LDQKVRLMLSDGQWERIEKLCKGKPEDPGGRGANNRMFVEAVLWIARTGSPWRDLPAIFGNSNSVFVRFNRWSKGGVWDAIFKVLADDPDFEYLILDSTIVRVHQHAAGGKGGFKIRRSAAPAAA
jgi:putative transposase